MWKLVQLDYQFVVTNLIATPTFYYRALGLLAFQVGCRGDSDSPLTQLSEGLRQMLVGNSATHKMVAALVVSFWKHCPGDLLAQFTAALTEQGVYEEITPFLLSLQKDCHVRI